MKHGGKYINRKYKPEKISYNSLKKKTRDFDTKRNTENIWEEKWNHDFLFGKWWNIQTTKMTQYKYMKIRRSDEKKYQ